MSAPHVTSTRNVADTIRQLPLPPGWSLTTVGDNGEVRLGRQRSPKNRSDKHPTPYVRAANLTWEGIDLSDVLEMEFRPEERTTYALREGDVLLSEASGSAGEVGKPVLWKDHADIHCFQNTVIRFRSRFPLPRFAYRMFEHYARNGVFAQVSLGVGIHHLGADRFASLPFRLPPLAEQHRIVDKIDDLFNDLEAAIASLKRAKANLKRYRASVLKAAVEGRLTSNRSITCKFFGELIDELGQGWSPKCDLNRPPTADEWAVIKTTAVQPLAYRDDEAKPLPASLEPRPRLEIKAGDFLMTRKGPRQRAGVTCFVRFTRPRLMVCDTVYRFRCNPDIVNALYLEIALNSPAVMQAIDRQKCGICDSGVSLTHDKLHAIPIPLPPLEEQTDIVRLVDERFSQIDAAEKTIDAELIRSKKLRQGILKQAFEGTLVPQNPTNEQAGTALT